MTNAEIARIIREIALFLDMEGVPFKPRAYEKAAHAIESVDEPLAEVYRRGGLKAIESELGIERTEETRDMRGHDAVRLWRRFERGDEEALEILLEYNRQDVENLRPLMRYAYGALRARCLGGKPPRPP